MVISTIALHNHTREENIAQQRHRLAGD